MTHLRLLVQIQVGFGLSIHFFLHHLNPQVIGHQPLDISGIHPVEFVEESDVDENIISEEELPPDTPSAQKAKKPKKAHRKV